MDGLMPTMAAATGGSGVAIPLDLVSSLAPYREQGGLSIRVERLPFKARLSKGRNNGDNSWSLTLEDLDGLQYLPPEDLADPHNLTVRVIRVDSDSASTLMRFDVPIGPGAPPPAGAPNGTAPPADLNGQNFNGYADAASPAASSAPAEPAPAAYPGGQNGVYDPSAAAAAAHTHPPMQAAGVVPPPNAYASAPPPAGGAYDQANETRIAQEVERRLGETRAAWEAEHQNRVAAAVQDAVRAAEAQARDQLDQTTEVRLALELERRLGEARASWEAELQGRIAVAVDEAVKRAEAEAGAPTGQDLEALIAQESDRRLGEARAAWEVEHQGRVTAAVQDAVQRAEADIRAQMEQAGEARLAQEVDRRLAEARSAWEAELQGRVAVAVEDAMRKADAGASAQSAQANEALVAQEVDRRLAEARAAWEAEYQTRVAAAVQDAVYRAEADIRAQTDHAGEARLAQEVDRRLAEARTAWEAELQGRVGQSVQEAVQRTQADSRIQLERAQQEWRDGSAREMAELSARCAQAEAALAETRSQAPASQEAEHALRGLRDELASAQALTRTRESELNELRQRLDRGGAEMSGRVAEAEAQLERSRAAWQAEREDLLTKAEENTQERIKQALERWQHETQESLTKAKQEWIDAEETRLAVAESQWRENIGIAKSRAPITPMMKRARRMHFAGRIKHMVIVTVGLAAAYYFYPRIEPVVVDQWWPKIGSYTDKIEPAYRKAMKDLKAWLVKMEKQGEAHLKKKKDSKR